MSKSTPTSDWTTSGRQIMCSLNGGSSQEFLTQGVAYSPTPIGQSSIEDPLGKQNSAIWQRDLPNIRAMGANSIRIYGMDATKRKNCKDALDACWNGGTNPIFVTLSLWINSTGTAIDELTTLQQQFQWIGEDYGNHPAVLGFSIGSEYNTPTNIASSSFWTDFQTLVTAVKQGISTAGGKKLISTGFVDLVMDNEEKTIVQGESNSVGIDVWGIDVYRGDTFSNLWSQIESATSKPFVITEFGVPASYHPESKSCKASEIPTSSINGSPVMQEVVTYMTSLWNDIETNSAVTKASNISSGGYIFAWSDEWWKSSQCGANDVHSGGSAKNPSFPGGWDDEEWFGLNSIAKGSPNDLTQRATYTYFKSIWGSGTVPVTGLPSKAATVSLQNDINNPVAGRKIKFNYTSDIENENPRWETAVEIDALGAAQNFTFPAGTNGISMIYEAEGKWLQGCQIKGTALNNVKDGASISGNWIEPNGNGTCPVG